jgi:mRNA-degrading endonuclease toxin of MazEF toxin-antitoxin module
MAYQYTCRAGDAVWVDFEIPQGIEPGFARPSIVIAADLVLAANPTTLHVIPITSNTTRRLPTEIAIDIPTRNIQGMAQVHLCSAISR